MSNESEEFTNEVEVSVLLPIYGSAPYIRETIESILNQDYKFFELIIVLDRAEKWVVNYVERIPLIWEKTKILKSLKPGITSALNLGLENSSGKYIARIDSDDIMHTNRISIQKNHLDNNSQVNCLGTQVLKINQNGEPLGQTKFPTLYGDVARILTYRNCLAHPSVMFRKQAVIDLGGYSEDFNGCEDYELWLRISASGQVENLSQILTSYRTWPGQFTNLKQEHIFKQAFYARVKYVAMITNGKSEIKSFSNFSANLGIRRLVLIANELQKDYGSYSRYLLSTFYFNKIFVLKKKKPFLLRKILQSVNFLLAFVLNPNSFIKLLASINRSRPILG